MRFTKFIFRGSAFPGYFLLRTLLRIKAFGAGLIEFCKKVSRKIINKFRTYLGRIARITGFLSPVKPNENRLVSKNVSPQILITGGYGYGNVGDEAQLGTNITRWRKLRPDCELRVFSPNPEYTAKHHNVESVWAPRVIWFDSNRSSDYVKSNKRFQKQFFKVKRRMILSARFLRAGLNIMFCSPAEAQLLSQIREADILHISGGGFLTGMTRSRLWENCLLMRLCHLLGTPVVLTGQTIGVFKSRADRRLAGWGLENAEYIYLRDNGESENDVRSLGISGEHIKSTCDDALFCEKSDQGTIKAVLKEHGIEPSHPFIAVNFHFWGQSGEMKNKTVGRFAEICDYLSDKGNIRILFIPMVASDEAPEKAVIEAMASEAKLLKYNYDYRITRGLIAEARFCFTMKHHPIIFAYGEEVPVISVALDDYYYRKNKGAMAHCGQEKYCLDEKTFFSPKAFELIDELSKNLDPEKAKISSWKNSINMLEPLDKIKL
jgi:polysaccharide pyruvyl transferase WcaK-like protein